MVRVAFHGALHALRRAAAWRRAKAPPLPSIDSLIELAADWYWQQDTQYRLVHARSPRGALPNHAGGMGLCRWNLPGATPLTGTWEEHRAQLDLRQPFRDFQYALFMPGQAARYRSASGAPRFDSRGRFLGYHGVTLDVTQHWESRKRMQNMEAMLRMATTMGRLGAWSLDLPGMKLTWSDEVCAIHEVPSGCPLTWKEALAFYAPHDRDVLSAALTQCMAGTAFDLELRIITARQRWLWVRAMGAPERNAEGTVVRIQGACQDITSLKESAEQARELADRLTMTLESLTEAFMTLDKSWRVTYVNQQAERLLQRHRRELLGRNLWDEFPEAMGGPIHAAYQKALEHDAPVELETHYAPLDIWIHLRACPSPQGLAVSFHDITERVKAKDEILRLNADLEERVKIRTAELQVATLEMEAFSYSVAHDLRSPLSSINGYSRLLEEREGGQLSGQGKHYVQRIRNATRQMDDLTEGLLSLARLSRASMHREVVDIAHLCRDIVCTLRDQDPERKVDVELMPDLWAEADVPLLRQALHNLVANAWKFTARQSAARIEVGMEMGADYEAVYYVKDNGAGFDMAHASKLFGMFQRLHSATDFPGTGIGLATVHKIVTRHDGRIWAESAPGQGASFYFTLSSPQVA